MADELPPPIEIPWRLASTTLPRVAGDPDQTALSLFFYEPDDKVLTRKFPDDRLVYVKATATISPATFPDDRRGIAATYLGEGVPCLHVLLDLEVRNPAGGPGDIRPYFHAAAPMHRRLIQTGVVGAEQYEGEADGQFMGRSGSQMYETLTSASRTTSAGGGASLSLGPVSLGGSIRSTSTDVSSDRSVAQVIDTTTRQASDERRELISHTTRIENVLTLLNAKYVGTPYLSFSLAPQPLQLLSIDASDPNLWFNQLLNRRSTGIEGIQEFTAVLLVPRGEDFCIDARLRRVCLLDSPPGPFTLDERFDDDLDLLQLARMVDYLNRTYPKGTPVDDLDVDVTPQLSAQGDFIRPAIALWGLDLLDSLVQAHVVSPTSASGVVDQHAANYKHFFEVWLDTLYDEYDRELIRSPLERGILLGENRNLQTCFALSGGDEVVVDDFTSSTTPLTPVDIDLGRFDVGAFDVAVAEATRGGGNTRSRALSTITRWNSLERQVTGLLETRRNLPERPNGLDDPGIFRVLLDRWSKLRPDDARNLPFDAAAKLVGLSAEQREKLQKAGVRDLRGIARALQAAPIYESQNASAAALRRNLERRGSDVPPPANVDFGLSTRDGEAVLKAIKTRLGKNPPNANAKA